ncbi:MAG: hypothetical protein JWP10_1141 [Nocardioidaceae bacterium]|nr:hypothetical protein [Nocardioidaceae bacterium]
MTAMKPGTFARRDLIGGQIALIGLLAMGFVTVLSIAVTGSIGTFYGLAFVLISVTLPLSAHIKALFVPGILPPIMMIVSLTLIALFDPSAIQVDQMADSAGVVQRVINGLISQAAALVLGHLLALLTIWFRIATRPETT